MLTLLNRESAKQLSERFNRNLLFPVFSGGIEYLILNPWWNVPRKLAVKDKSPLFRKDPGSLGHHVPGKPIGTSRKRIPLLLQRETLPSPPIPDFLSPPPSAV